MLTGICLNSSRSLVKLLHSGEEGQLVLGARLPRDDNNCEAGDSHNQAENHQKNCLDTRKKYS